MFRKVFAKFGRGAKTFLIYIFYSTISSSFLNCFFYFAGSPPAGQEEQSFVLPPNSLISQQLSIP